MPHYIFKWTIKFNAELTLKDAWMKDMCMEYEIYKTNFQIDAIFRKINFQTNLFLSNQFQCFN